MVPEIHLNICDEGKLSALLKSNRMVASRFASSSTVSCFTTARDETKVGSVSFPQDRLVHTVQLLTIPQSRISFIQATLLIFNQSQAIYKDQNQKKNKFKGIQGVGGSLSEKNSIKSSLTECLTTISTQYQEALHKHCLVLADQSDRVETALFSGLHGIWQMAHLVFIIPSNTPILTHLDEWLQFNFTQSLSEMYIRINALSSPKSDDAFWPLVYFLLI